MRLKLNTNTTYILVPDGIYLRSNRSALSVRGKNLDQFLELLPTLNGDYTLEEITQELSANKKIQVTKFLKVLLSAGFLKDTSQDRPHTLTQAELATYSSDIAFIDTLQSSAASRFAAFRNKKLLIIGSGLSFTALVQASVRCGIKEINTIRTPECGIIPDSQLDLLDQSSQNDPEQRVQAMVAPQWEDEADVLNTIQAYDALLHISDRPMLARAQRLNKLCIEQQKTFIQAIVVDDHVWIGPLVSAETGGCWECAWRRLQANLTDCSEQYMTFQDHTTATISQFFSLPAAVMAANQLAFELFKHFTQARRPIAGSLVDIHLETLLCERHVFLPHAHCHTCQHPATLTAEQFLKHMEELQQQAPLTSATFCENMAHFVDHQLGLFTSLDTDDFVQAPLAVYKVGLSNPMLLSHSKKPLEVIGVGIDRSSAKVNACQRACEYYAAGLVDQRRLLQDKAMRQQNAPTIPVERLIGEQSHLTGVETWTWALDLHTQQVGLIPASLAFPSLQHGEGLRTGDIRGIGSGMSWAEAICQALFDWCTFLAIEEVKGARQQLPLVDLAKIPMTSEGEYLLHLLQTLGKQVTVYNVTGVLQVPTFAICVDKSVVSYSTHCDVAQAISLGIRQAVQQYQSMQEHQPEYALVPVPDLPEQAQGSQGQTKGRAGLAQGTAPTDDHALPEAWPARQEWLQQTLQAHNFHAWALPLDHDPALAQVFPFIARVFLFQS